MGIKGYVRTILEKYPSIHSSLTVTNNTNYLLFDFNSLIYGAVAIVSHSKNSIGRNFTPLIINVVIKIVKNIINIIKPSKSVYIAIDGVVPMAKIHVQRERAYHALLDNEFKDSVLGKQSKTEWNKMQIKPGTEFMAALSKQLKAHKWKIKMIISDDSEPGEGEHKIMDYIATLKDANMNICIVSPDSDMLVLPNKLTDRNHHYTIISPTNDKEYLQKQYEKEEYVAISLDVFNDAWMTEFGIVKNTPLNIKNILYDFSFFTMFAENDFVKSFIYTRMNQTFVNKQTFVLLAEIYKKVSQKFETSPNRFMIHIDAKNKLTINYKFMIEFVREIASNETTYLRELQQKYQNSALSKFAAKKNAESKKKEDYAMILYTHQPLYKSIHPLYAKYNQQFKQINYYAPETVWKKQYYTFFFGDNITVDTICLEYLHSLEFAIQYYLTKLPSWTYYYPYIAAPLPSDFLEYLQSHPYVPYKFTLAKPYTFIEQMLHNITYKDVEILPDAYRKIVLNPNNEKYYPRANNLKVNVVQGEKMMYANIILPTIPNNIARNIARIKP
jgi:5'-3' exonuclease